MNLQLWTMVSLENSIIQIISFHITWFIYKKLTRSTLAYWKVFCLSLLGIVVSLGKGDGFYYQVVIFLALALKERREHRLTIWARRRSHHGSFPRSENAVRGWLPVSCRPSGPGSRCGDWPPTPAPRFGASSRACRCCRRSRTDGRKARTLSFRKPSPHRRRAVPPAPRHRRA